MDIGHLLAVGLKFGLPVALAFGLARYLMQSKRARQKPGINWDPTDAVTLTLVLYFASQVAAAIGLLVWGVAHHVTFEQVVHQSDKSTFLQFLASLVMYGFVAGGLWWLLRRRGRNFKSLGLRRPVWRDVWFVPVGIAMYFLLVIITMGLAGQLFPSLNLDQKQQLGFDASPGGNLWMVFVSLVLLPPLVEELVCRGFLYLGLKTGWPKYVAVIITSALFATAHLQFDSGAPLLWSAAIDTFVLSLILIYLREATNGLWAPIGLHMSKNLLAFSLLFLR